MESYYQSTDYAKREQVINKIEQNCRVVKKDEDLNSPTAYVGTFLYVDKDIERIEDKFYIVTKFGTIASIKLLYESITLSDSQKEKIQRLEKNNKNIITTLNIGILDNKFSFLKDLFDELVLDIEMQDILVKLTDFDLMLLKLVFAKISNQEFNIYSLVCNVITKLDNSNWNKDSSIYEFKNLLYDKWQNEYKFCEKELDSIIYVLCSACPIDDYLYKNRDITNVADIIKKSFIDDSRKYESLEDLQRDFLYYFYNIAPIVAKKFVSKYNLDGIQEEYLSKSCICHYNIINYVVNAQSLDQLILFVEKLVNNRDFFNNPLDIALFTYQLKSLYAEDLNQVKPNLDCEKAVSYDGIDVYRLENDFKLKVRVLGAFDFEKNLSTSVYNHYNRDEYYPILSCCVIYNDNIAIVDDDKPIVGYEEFDKSLFLSMGNRDIISFKGGTEFGHQNIYEEFYFSDSLKDNMRDHHSEVDYLFRNKNAQKHYKRNPDFVVYVEEKLIDQIDLTKKVNNAKWTETVNMAKEFGNIPILIINREYYAKRELAKMDDYIRKYCTTLDYRYIHELITRFANNRNCSTEFPDIPGFLHDDIIQTYFSDEIFDKYMQIIFQVILSIDIDKLKNNLEDEIYKTDLGDYMNHLKLEKYVEEINSLIREDVNIYKKQMQYANL